MGRATGRRPEVELGMPAASARCELMTFLQQRVLREAGGGLRAELLPTSPSLQISLRGFCFKLEASR
jgi:hypothetical protein